MKLEGLPARFRAAGDRFFLVHERDAGWLDGLRSIAILLVIAFHLYTGPYMDMIQGAHGTPNRIFAALAAFGWTGVPLFFTISGFLVGGSVLIGLIEGHLDPLRFFARRIVRTVLSAIAFLRLANLLFPTIPEVGLNIATAQSMLFVSNYAGDAAFGHWWGLCVEEQVYLGLCLVAAVTYTVLKGTERARSASWSWRRPP